MWKHSFPEASFQWNAGTQTTKHIWLMTHRSHGTLAFTDASDLPKPLEQIPMWTPLLKTAPPRISCAVCFNSDWNSGFTSQVWTEGLHIKSCGGKGCIYYTRSATRSIRGQYEVSLYGLSRSSPWASEARFLHLSWHLLWKQWAAKTSEYLSYWFFLPTELRLGRPFGNWTGTPFTTYCTCIIFHSFALLLFI
jgi:hypothetical protein